MAIESGRFAPPDPRQESDFVTYIPTDEDYVYNFLSQRIEQTARGLNSLFHFEQNPSGGLIILDTLNGKIPLGGETLTMERDELQKITLDIMAEYGFDPDKSEVRTDNTDESGWRIEVSDYQSQTVNGLVFRRVTHGRQQTRFVSWSVHDEAPRINPRLKRLIPGISKKV